MSIRYKIIASILFLQSNILSAEGNSSGEISLSEAEISLYSEKALIQAVEYVRNNEINKALMLVMDTILNGDMPLDLRTFKFPSS